MTRPNAGQVLARTRPATIRIGAKYGLGFTATLALFGSGMNAILAPATSSRRRRTRNPRPGDGAEPLDGAMRVSRAPPTSGRDKTATLPGENWQRTRPAWPAAARYSWGQLRYPVLVRQFTSTAALDPTIDLWTAPAPSAVLRRRVDAAYAGQP